MHLILFDTTIPFHVVVCFNAIPESPLHEYRKICPRLSPVTPCCPFSPGLRRCAQSKEKGRKNRDEAISRRPSLRFPFADRARHIGGKKAGLSFNWRTLSCKNKMRRSRNETSGIDAGMNCPVQQESARRCTYHTRPRSRGNTDLLTCVREQMLLRPHPTFSQVIPAMANFRPGGLLRFGVASRAQHRFVSA